MAAPPPPEEAPLVPEEVPLLPEEAPLVPEEAPLVPEEAPLVPEDAPLVPEEEAPLVPERITATLADEVISFCEAAIARLEEAAATLHQEDGDKLENIAAAGDLVHATFHYTVQDPEGGPLHAALRGLVPVIRPDDHTLPQRDFTAFANALGLVRGDPTWQRWDSGYALADSRARMAVEWLKAAQRESLEAGVAIRLCVGDWELREAAERRLQQAISQANQALAALHAMRDTLAELEQIVINGAAAQVLPP